MELRGKNLIGFGYSSQSEVRFKAINPNENQKLEPDFSEATYHEVDRAIKLADQSFDAYNQKSHLQRADFLEAIADEIDNLGDELFERCNQETALPLGRLKGERGRTTSQLRLFAQIVREGSWVDATIDHGNPERSPIPKPDTRSMLHAIGPVVVFGASNFPLAFSVAGGDTASALAAGCPTIVKGHPAHPGTSELIGRAIINAAMKTNMPEGVFSLIQGKSHQVGRYMVQHPLVKAVGFTGSYRGGKAIFDLACSRPEPIPVFAEMGSTNPVFILPGKLKKDIDKLAEGMVKSITLGTGQFCTNPGIQVIIDSPESTEYLKALRSGIANSPSSTMLTPDISKSYFKGISDLKEHSKVLEEAKGAHEGHSSGQPYLLSTSIDYVLENPSITHEVFGPSSVLVKAITRDQVFQFARKLEGHLTATIMGNESDLEDFRDLVDVLRKKVGRIIYNGFPTGVEVGHSMIHGGPFPATTDSRTTSVGTKAIYRFARPVCYQDFPNDILPDALKDDNPLEIIRKIDGELVIP